MSNVLQFPQGGMTAIVRKAAAEHGTPVVEIPFDDADDVIVPEFDCDAGSPEWKVRLKRAIAKYGPPCADNCEVELVQMLDEHEAEHGRWHEPPRGMSGADLWTEYSALEAEIADQYHSSNIDHLIPRCRALSYEIKRRLYDQDHPTEDGEDQ